MALMAQLIGCVAGVAVCSFELGVETPQALWCSTGKQQQRLSSFVSFLLLVTIRTTVVLLHCSCILVTLLPAIKRPVKFLQKPQ